MFKNVKLRGEIPSCFVILKAPFQHVDIWICATLPNHLCIVWHFDMGSLDFNLVIENVEFVVIIKGHKTRGG